MGAIENIRTFLGEVRSETKKVTWPKRAELRESTTVVVVAVFLMTALISVVDLGLNKVLGFVMSIGGR
jgi:preprotein translocase subunit SecE